MGVTFVHRRDLVKKRPKLKRYTFVSPQGGTDYDWSADHTFVKVSAEDGSVRIALSGSQRLNMLYSICRLSSKQMAEERDLTNPNYDAD